MSSLEVSFSASRVFTLGSFDNSAWRLDMDGTTAGIEELGESRGLVCPALRAFGEDGHSGRHCSKPLPSRYEYSVTLRGSTYSEGRFIPAKVEFVVGRHRS